MNENHGFIRLDGLSKGFREGGQTRGVLRGADAEFARGEFVAIVGKSGSGKSTLLNLISGIDLVDRGDIWVNGQRLTTLNERQRTLFRRHNVGFIFQFFNLIPTLTVWENVILPLELAGVDNGKARRRTETLLEAVGLLDRRDAFPDRLSGGEQQRVAIARAMILNPGIILADEPTGNLDTKTGADIIELMQRLNKERGKTFIIVTHDRRIAEGAERALYLMDGRLSDVPPDEY
jgi:putative ABC transport system ATP-binding protein